MNKTHDKISEWTESLSERLAEIRFWDAAEMKMALKVHLALAMKDCLVAQVTETQKKINRVKILLSNNPGKEHGKYQAELVKLKEQARQEQLTLNQSSAIIRKDEKFKIFALMVAQKFGNEVLEEMKQELKTKMNIITKDDPDKVIGENAYDKGVRETLIKLRTVFEDNGLWDAIKYLN